MNIVLLEEKIRLKGLSISMIAVSLGISRQGLYNKLNGKREFKSSEIAKLSELLGLSKDEREAIFFADYVDDKVYSPSRTRNPTVLN